MSSISLKVNGHVHTVDVDPETPLLYVLSDELRLHGPKFGCSLAQCGACTVIIGGQAVRSCVMPVSAVKQQEVTTLEGLGLRNIGMPSSDRRAFRVSGKIGTSALSENHAKI